MKIFGTESTQLEFKSSFQKEVIESLVAFANTKGGAVLIGVDDQGQPKGVNLQPETVKDWLNQIKNSTYPRIIPDAEVFEESGKTIVKLSIQEQPIKPIAYKQRYYKRVLNANHLMSLDEIASEHLKNAQLQLGLPNRYTPHL